MGISSLPAPSEGILTLILVNTAFSISIFKKIAVFLLDFLRPVRSPSADSDDDPAHDSLTDRFRLRARASRYGSHDPSCGPADCRVCLGRFDLESVVNRLPCGHLFHKVCLERWLDYHHFTCPLCRTQLLPPVCASS